MSGRSRFFVDGVVAAGDLVALAPADAHKLRVVLRARPGALVDVVDSSGTRYEARLDADGARVAIERAVEAPPPRRLRIVLAQALPKGQKMDFVVEKATELGVERIVPFASARSTADRARDGKVERWRRLARTAAAQCGRADVPAIDEPCDFESLVRTLAPLERVLVPYELAPRVPLRERLPDVIAGARNVAIVIGPEGGFDVAEIDLATAAGAAVVSLGARILRTETAGLVACAAVLVASGEL